VIWRVRIAQAGSRPELDEAFPTLPAALSKAAMVMESEARRLWEAEAELDQPAAAEAPEAEETAEPDPGYVLFVWSPAGYALLTRSGEPPPVGSEVGVSGGRLVVMKIGPSPLPGDRRRCAFLDAP